MNKLMESKQKKGHIELIIGCMFAGKTEFFIRKISRYNYAGYKTVVFKPTIDTRNNDMRITSHSGKKLEATIVEKAEDIWDYITDDIDVIGIDELQFFDPNIIEILDKLANQNFIVIANGLDKDFRGEPFNHVINLLPKAESIIKLRAICTICGAEGDRTQRIIQGHPASKTEKTILIGDNNFYQARCRHHHEFQE